VNKYPIQAIRTGEPAETAKIPGESAQKSRKQGINLKIDVSQLQNLLDFVRN